MSTVQYSHNAIEDVRLGVGKEGDFATFESGRKSSSLVLTARASMCGVASGVNGLYPPRHGNVAVAYAAPALLGG